MEPVIGGVSLHEGIQLADDAETFPEGREVDQPIEAGAEGIAMITSFTL